MNKDYINSIKKAEARRIKNSIKSQMNLGASIAAEGNALFGWRRQNGGYQLLPGDRSAVFGTGEYICGTFGTGSCGL